MHSIRHVLIVRPPPLDDKSVMRARPRRTRETGAVTTRAFDPSRIGRGLAFAAAVDDVTAALDHSTAVVISPSLRAEGLPLRKATSAKDPT